MIVVPGPLDAPASRLLEALAMQGESVCDLARLPVGDDPVTLAVSTGAFVFDFAGTVAALAGRRFRVLMLSRLGAHPDAKADSLRRLWRLEEHVRGGGAPTLTLRFAPLVGPASPLWRKLASGPSLPRGGRMLVNPVAEEDALATLVRALGGQAEWRDWFEVAGPEAFSLAELRELATHGGARGEPGAWEPALEEMAEHRLAEAEPWLSHFGLVATPLAARSRAWAA